MQEIIENLRANGFRLGGSRRMNEKYPDLIRLSPNTDWDFYREDSQESRVHLDELGFNKVIAKNRDYWDHLLVDIYKHPDYQIEVLLRSDVELYTRAFESISGEDFHDRLWKSGPAVNYFESRNIMRASICDYFNVLFEQHREKAA